MFPLPDKYDLLYVCIVAFKTTNCLRPCIERLFAREFRYDMTDNFQRLL
jgi:hypothetical protein